MEGAFIIPIVLFTMFSLIYLTYYLRDICRVQSVINQTLDKASYIMRYDMDFTTEHIPYEKIGNNAYTNSIKNNILEQHLKKELKAGLCILEIERVNVSFGTRMEVWVEARSNISLSYVRAQLAWLNKASIYGKRLIHNPPETIRAASVILDLGEQIKGVEEQKNKLIKLIETIGN